MQLAYMIVRLINNMFCKLCKMIKHLYQLIVMWDLLFLIILLKRLHDVIFIFINL